MIEVISGIIALIGAIFGWWVIQKKKETASKVLHDSITEAVERERKNTTTDSRARSSYARRQRIDQLLDQAESYIPPRDRKTDK